METKSQIEKLKEQYNELLRELKILEEEHSILDKDYKELNTKKLEINDQIDDIEEEVMKIRDKIKDEEIKYIDIKNKKTIKIIILATAIITTLLSLTIGNLVLLQKLVIAVFYTISIASFTSLIVLNSKTQNKIKNQYRQTENYINNAELIEQKIKEKNELKIAKISLGDDYALYKKVSNLEQQIEDKQKEIEEIKQKVFEIFFSGTKEEITNEQVISYCDEEEKSTPLIKTRRIDN